ncbi:MAG: acyl--CoA ligase family protein [Ferrimicrobium sp.]
MQTANYAPLTPLLLLERTASVYPSRTAVVYEKRRYDYATLRERVHRLAGALRQLGVDGGDRVAVLCPNSPPILEAHFGVPLAGALLVAINTQLSRIEIRTILEHSQSKVIIVDEELISKLEGLRSEVPSLEHVVVARRANEHTSGGASVLAELGEADQLLDYESLLEAPPLEVDLLQVDERGPISINYTSGTTGNPKGVVYHHRGAYLNALAEIIETRMTQASVYLWTLPMFHCNGWCFPWAVSAIGGTHVLIRKVVAEHVVQLIEEEGVTHLSGAPTVLTMIAQELERTGRSFPRPVRVITAGAPPSPKVLRTIESLGAEVLHVYGLTEVYGPFTVCEWNPDWDELPIEDRAKKKARQGVAYIGLGDLRVVDRDTGEDVERDGETLGEVLMRGNGVMTGYYNNDQATAEAFAGGWFHTGDIAVWYPDGYVELKDRAKDIIISGGENVSTQDVEKVILEHPSVLEAAVIGIPDERWGEVPKAFVTLAAGKNATEKELTEFCRERLAHFKCPKAIEFCELPKTSTGKIQKSVLREREGVARKSS